MVFAPGTTFGNNISGRNKTAEQSDGDKLIDYAAGCSWHGGGFLAEDMKNNHFQDWERVIVATEPCPKTEKDQIAGFTTVAKTDVINLVSYTPYIGYVFVDEAFRGRQVFQHFRQSNIPAAIPRPAGT